MTRWKFLFCLILLLALSPASLFPLDPSKENKAGSTLPYGVNERLVFDASYFAIEGGTVVLEVAGIEKVGGRDAYHIVSTAKTTKFFSRIYEVNDVIESFIDKEKQNSLKIKIDQHEGSTKKKGEIIFDQEHNKAIIPKERNKKIVYDIVENVQDSLSSLFHVRRQKLEVGKDIVFDTYASRKNWQLVVQVLKKERIKVKAGTFNTILVKPLLKYNDVFINKGDVYVWLTDDEKKMPVKMKSEIIIGSISVELKEYKY